MVRIFGQGQADKGKLANPEKNSRKQAKYKRGEKNNCFICGFYICKLIHGSAI